MMKTMLLMTMVQMHAADYDGDGEFHDDDDDGAVDLMAMTLILRKNRYRLVWV